MKNKTAHSTLQLWLMLAAVPITILLSLFLIVTFAFDDESIIEIDPSQSRNEISNVPDIEINDLDRDFAAPLDVPSVESPKTIIASPSVFSDINTKSKEQSLTQMLSKKNENLQIDSNGHPLIIRVQENDNLKVLANRYLGDSAFWPYIYIVNKEKVSAADVVKAGMTLYLPDSIYYDINVRDSLSIKKAESLGKAIK